MNVKTEHEWEVYGRQALGKKPYVYEWQCIYCGLIICDGKAAPSPYCEEE